MKADRVFPNNIDTDMGSKIEFNGIDWKSVEDNIHNNRFAQDNTSEIINMIKELTGVPPEEIQNIVDEAAIKFSPDSAPTDSMGGEAPRFDDGFDANIGGSGDFAQEGELASVATSQKEVKTAKINKIAFTHPDQISADAIEKALADGNTKLANTILAARKENRLRIANAIKGSLSSKSNKVAQANNDSIWVKTFSGQPDKLREAIDAMKASGINTTEAESALAQMQTAPQQGNTSMPLESMKFSSPLEFTKAQRLAFNQVAASLGMPDDYINAMTTKTISLTPEVTSLNDKIKEVFSSNISSETKNSFIKSLIKESKLSNDSKSEFIDYWNNVLGYQDKEFWPEVTKEYGEKGN